MPEYHRPEEEIADELADQFPGGVTPKGGRLPAVPTRDEIFQLLAASEEGRDRLCLRTMYATGVRVSEVAGFVFADVLYSERKLFVRSGKGDKDRYVIADSVTFDQLAAWQGEHPIERSIFDVTDRTVGRMVKAAGEATGLLRKYEALGRTLSPHCFRHAFATHCYENGMDLFTLKKLLGHQFLDTTELYIEVGMSKWRREYDKAHELAKPGPGPQNDRKNMA